MKIKVDNQNNVYLMFKLNRNIYYQKKIIKHIDIANYSNIEIDLIKRFESVDMFYMLENYILGIDFIINYFLDDKYKKIRKELGIDINTIISLQPHLKQKMIQLLK